MFFATPRVGCLEFRNPWFPFRLRFKLGLELGVPSHGYFPHCDGTYVLSSSVIYPGRGGVRYS